MYAARHRRRTEAWFNRNPQVHETVMAYVVRCAMTKSQSLAYYNPEQCGSGSTPESCGTDCGACR